MKNVTTILMSILILTGCEKELAKDPRIDVTSVTVNWEQNDYLLRCLQPYIVSLDKEFREKRGDKLTLEALKVVSFSPAGRYYSIDYQMMVASHKSSPAMLVTGNVRKYSCQIAQ